MRKLIITVVSLILLFLISDKTLAFIGDTEKSLGQWNAASVLIDLQNEQDQLLSQGFVTTFIPTTGNDFTFKIKNKGSLNPAYQLDFMEQISTNELCNQVNASVEVNGVLSYNGALSSLRAVRNSIDNGNDLIHVVLTFNSTDSQYESSVCSYALKVRAYQSQSDGTWGYQHQKMFLNMIETGATPTITPSPTPTLTQTVVINEVMWMGSTKSVNDEWIELRNLTDHEIDIGKWSVDNGHDSGEGSLIMSNSRKIPAKGYFLIAHWPESSSNTELNAAVGENDTHISLLNTGEQLTLRDQNGNIIDQTPVGMWSAGVNGTLKQSMERNDIPGDGTIGSNWHTCLDSGCTSTTFWDHVGNNYGTPGSANLSDNDPTTILRLPDLSLEAKFPDPMPIISSLPEAVVAPVCVSPTTVPMSSIFPTSPVITITPIVPTEMPTVLLTPTPEVTDEIKVNPCASIIPPTQEITPEPSPTIDPVVISHSYDKGETYA